MKNPGQDELKKSQERRQNETNRRVEERHRRQLEIQEAFRVAAVEREIRNEARRLTEVSRQRDNQERE